MPNKGEQAPEFILPSTRGEVSLSELLRDHQKVVLAFYSEASTPRCAQEISALKDEYGTLRELGAEVVGVSADGPQVQRAFEAALGGCPFPLASDEALETAEQYDALSDDGKRSRRAVFVIDKDGSVLHAISWYQPGNPAQFMEIFEALGMQG